LLVVGVSLLDVIASTSYIALILLFARKIRQHVTTDITKKYFLPFILIKIVFAILFVLLHSYYYQGGDTFLYFAGAKSVSEQMIHAPTKMFSFLFGGAEAFNQIIYTNGFLSNELTNSSSLSMFQITSLFYLAGFKQFMATTILFSMVSAIGVWSIFSVFCKLYPKIHRLFAIGTLFYPTFCIWGSGILKDTLILFAIGIMFGSFYLLKNKKRVITSLFIILFGGFLCLHLKAYILYTFIPPMIFWQYSSFTENIKSRFLKYSVAPFVLIIFALGGLFLLNSISDNAGKYALDNMESVAEGFQSWHNYLSETRGQTGYSIGEVEYTTLGVISKSPEAFFVTFYRPLPFEINNFATAFESIQSTILLLISLFIVFKIGFFRTLKIIFRNPDVRIFLIFAVTLGIAVGITSFNFGALSRYKIPALPFYTASLAIIFWEGKKIKSKKTNV